MRIRRIAAATVAVATALSLSTAVASAQDARTSDGVKILENSAELLATAAENPDSDTYDKEASAPFAASSEAFAGAIEGSSEENQGSAIAASSDVTLSSLQNDIENGYAYGTTWDIIIGVLISLGIAGAAVASGAIQLPADLPALPF